MGHFFWISSTAVAGAIVFSLSTLPEAEQGGRQNQVATSYLAVQPEENGIVTVGTSGSALATAAFGLDALQPETFNVEIVQDIIEASPLDFGEKDRLIAKLFAAEAGQAELPRVLTDIRVSLAVE